MRGGVEDLEEIVKCFPDEAIGLPKWCLVTGEIDLQTIAVGVIPLEMVIPEPLEINKLEWRLDVGGGRHGG